MSTIKTGLFGGALVAAGLTANAQNFVYSAYDSTGTTQSYAVSYAPYETYDYAFGPDSKNTYVSSFDSSYGRNTFATTQDATSMSATGQWAGDGSNGYGFGLSYILQYFQVSQDAQLFIEWDFTNTDNFVSGELFLDPSGTNIWTLDGLGGDPATGSATIGVQAGVNYGIAFGLADGFGPFLFDTNQKFVTVTLVPAPGAASILGLCGLAIARRRR